MGALIMSIDETAWEAIEEGWTKSEMFGDDGVTK
ncbi:hypothetical protein Golax_004265, partial [Gossypium laxum]|nr:hypothetical protein [Gossypium laxum]